MSMVEEIIRKKPENWLWSHKRWKYSQESIEKIKEYNRIRKEKEKSSL